MDNKEIYNAVHCLEDQDRWVTSAYLNQKFENPQITLTQILYPVDMIVDVCGITYNIEIKKREKNNYILNRFPFAELKVSKYENMLKVSENTPLFYFVLLNEKWLYGFDLRQESTWKDSFTYEWEIKKTQVDDDDSETEIQEIYEIPYRNAQIKECVGKYYQMYYNIK